MQCLDGWSRILPSSNHKADESGKCIRTKVLCFLIAKMEYIVVGESGNPYSTNFPYQWNDYCGGTTLVRPFSSAAVADEKRHTLPSPEIEYAMNRL